MSARIITFLNFKGGVGKTANVVNIGACLSFHHRRRVLIVDLDAQCNSTFWLMRPFEYQKALSMIGGDGTRFSTYQLFQDALDESSLFSIQDSIIQGVPRSSGGVELLPRLHLLPGHIRLMEIEFNSGHPNVSRLMTALKLKLQEVEGLYDYILIDCPPNLFHVTQSALFAAHHVTVPFNPDYLSLSGFKILSQQITYLSRTFQEITGTTASQQISALIINRYQRVGEAYTTAISELEGQMDQLREAGMIHPKCLLLDPPVRQDVKIAESTSEHKPVLLHDPTANGTKDYIELTKSFLQHFEETLK